jgi:hypothetical protein
MAGTQTQRAHERRDQPGEAPADYFERHGRMRLIRRFEQDILVAALGRSSPATRSW